MGDTEEASGGDFGGASPRWCADDGSDVSTVAGSDSDTERLMRAASSIRRRVWADAAIATGVVATPSATATMGSSGRFNVVLINGTARLAARSWAITLPTMEPDAATGALSVALLLECTSSTSPAQTAAVRSLVPRATRELGDALGSGRALLRATWSVSRGQWSLAVATRAQGAVHRYPWWKGCDLTLAPTVIPAAVSGWAWMVEAASQCSSADATPMPPAATSRRKAPPATRRAKPLVVEDDGEVAIVGEKTPMGTSARKKHRRELLDGGSLDGGAASPPTPPLLAEPIIIVTCGIRLSTAEILTLERLGIRIAGADTPELWNRCDVIVAEPPLGRSIKLLTALVSARFLLSRTWLETCLRSSVVRLPANSSQLHMHSYREAGTRASFEATHQCNLSKLLALPAAERASLLSGVRFFVAKEVTPQEKTGGNDVKILICAAGGCITTSAETADVVVVNTALPPTTKTSGKAAASRSARAKTVPHRTVHAENSGVATAAVTFSTEDIYKAVLTHRRPEGVRRGSQPSTVVTSSAADDCR